MICTDWCFYFPSYVVNHAMNFVNILFLLYIGSQTVKFLLALVFETGVKCGSREFYNTQAKLSALLMLNVKKLK